jgi:hypothetical protein
MLYTVLMEYRGGTYVSQVVADSVAGSLRVWAAALDVAAIAALGAQWKAELLRDIEWMMSNGMEPTPLDGLVSAWCTTASVSGGMMLINIVATASPKRHRSKPSRHG